MGEDAFPVRTAGGDVKCRVLDGGRAVRVAMGRASFASEEIPVAGPPREVLREPLEVDGERLEFSAATIGNPHCVVLRDELREQDVLRLGPRIERDPRFPNRTNVQLVQVRDRATLEIEIWERGAGHTLASGSSSCAAAAVAHRLGRCDARVACACAAAASRSRSIPTAASCSRDRWCTWPPATSATRRSRRLTRARLRPARRLVALGGERVLVAVVGRVVGLVAQLPLAASKSGKRASPSTVAWTRVR